MPFGGGDGDVFVQFFGTGDGIVTLSWDYYAAVCAIIARLPRDERGRTVAPGMRIQIGSSIHTVVAVRESEVQVEGDDGREGRWYVDGSFAVQEPEGQP